MSDGEQTRRLDMTETEATARSQAAIASEPWVMWALAGRWGFVGAAIAYWFGLIEVSPLDLAEWILYTVTGLQRDVDSIAGQLEGPLWLIRQGLAGFSWIILGVPWLSYVRYRVELIEAGSREMYEQLRREDAERSMTPQEAGVLEAVTIVKGGTFSAAETQIETSQGSSGVQ